MKPRILPILFLCVALCACRQKAAETPPIPPAQMEQILLDMQLAEVYSSMSQPDSITVNIKKTDSLALFSSEVLAHYGLSDSVFREGVTWYAYHPEELEKIYSRITDRLTAMDAERNN